MNKRNMLIAASLLALAGCGKFGDKAAAEKKKAEAQEAVTKAQAKLETRLAYKPENSNPNAAGGALVSLLCSSPKLVEDIANERDLLDALSGAGGDGEEAKQQFINSRNRYRPVLERKLPARGASFEDFRRYAAGREDAEQKRKLKALIAKVCPRGDEAALEKAAGDLTYYFSAQPPGK